MTAEAAKFLDEAATARMLNVGVRTLQRWRRAGGGPAFVRMGLRRVAYRISDVESWAGSRTFASRAAELIQQAA